MPKCEIFDRSDFHNFYTMKGDIRIKIICLKIFKGLLRAAKFLTRMLSLFFCVNLPRKALWCINHENLNQGNLTLGHL